MTENAPERHIVKTEETARPRPFRGPFSEVYRWLCIVYLTLGGWKMRGDWPDLPKCVVIAAPHTSNWDGINMLAAAGYFRIKLRWMGKKELVEGPFGWFVKWLGCVPVDRSGAGDLVKQMRETFEATDKMTLAVPPEGTRSKTRAWKTGFYHIAHTAGVPILMSVLDYGTKTMRISGVLTPSGDYDADFQLIKTHYEGAAGKYGRKFTLEDAHPTQDA
ncbi:MAG: lysophospholipid acyltransferase family protein [Pseudomonadota bacterium]